MRNIVVIVAGCLMLLAAFAHGLTGWPAVHAGLVSGHVPADFISLFAGSWLWATVSMLTFGTIVLISGMQMRCGKPGGMFAVRAIAVCYIGFGVLALIFEGYDLHSVLFIVLGLLAAASFFGARSAGPAS